MKLSQRLSKASSTGMFSCELSSTANRRTNRLLWLFATARPQTERRAPDRQKVGRLSRILRRSRRKLTDFGGAAEGTPGVQVCPFVHSNSEPVYEFATQPASHAGQSRAGD
jgi:hypothetical protein